MTSFGDIVSAVKSVATQVALGGDLTHISLPSVFCLPYTTIEMVALKRMPGMAILDEIVKIPDPLARFLLVLRWYFAGITVDEEFGKKPLNPILGETYRCQSGDYLFIGEQVSHHPPVTAFHFEHRRKDISFDGSAEVVAKFHGNSVAVDLKGFNKLRIDTRGCDVRKDGIHFYKKKKKGHHHHHHHHDTDEHLQDINENFIETYDFKPALPKGHARGLLFGAQFYELGGSTSISCSNGLTCDIEFKLASLFFGGKHQVKGVIKNQNETLANFSGVWDNVLKVEPVSISAKETISNYLPDNILYDAKAIEKAKIDAFNDCRDCLKTSHNVWAPVTAAIKSHDFTQADIEKHKVEANQNVYIKDLAKNDDDHKMVFFQKDDNNQLTVIPAHDAFRISKKDLKHR